MTNFHYSIHITRLLGLNAPKCALHAQIDIDGIVTRDQLSQTVHIQSIIDIICDIL